MEEGTATVIDSDFDESEETDIRVNHPPFQDKGSGNERRLRTLLRRKRGKKGKDYSGGR